MTPVEGARRRPWSRSLRFRYAIVFAAISATVAALVAGVLLSRFDGAMEGVAGASRETMRETLRFRFVETAAKTARTASNDLAAIQQQANTPEQLKTLIEARIRTLITQPDVRAAQVRIGETVFGDDFLDRLARPDRETVRNFADGVTAIVDGAGGRITAPFAGDGGHGELSLVLDTSRIQGDVELLSAQLGALSLARADEARAASRGVTLALAVLAALAGAGVAWRFTRPIEAIERASRRIAAGDYDVAIGYDSADELGALSRSIERMAGALKRTTVSKGFLDDVLKAMLDGLVVTDADGRIELANPAAQHLIGGELVGSRFADHLGAQPEAGAGAASGIAQAHVIAANGAATPILLSEARIATGPRRVAVFRDVTAIVKREQDLRIATEIAQSADRAKSEFLANMSHELRTPLNAIIGFSELMHSGIFGPLGDERYATYANDIHASGRHLLKIINDILDLSKVEAGRAQLHLDEFPPTAPLESAAAVLAPHAADAGVSLKVEIPPMPDQSIYADETKLKQVLLNIMSNAVKFSESGGVVTATIEPAAGGYVYVVADTGAGMSAEELATAVLPFRQVDNSHTRRFEGTGLGLPLAIRYAELHGGRVDFVTAPGDGTTVRIYIPEDAETATTPAAHAA